MPWSQRCSQKQSGLRHHHGSGWHHRTLRSAWPLWWCITQATTWSMMVAQTPGIHWAIGSNMSNIHEHRTPWLHQGNCCGIIFLYTVKMCLCQSFFSLDTNLLDGTLETERALGRENTESPDREEAVCAVQIKGNQATKKNVD